MKYINKTSMSGAIFASRLATLTTMTPVLTAVNTFEFGFMISNGWPMSGEAIHPHCRIVVTTFILVYPFVPVGD